jgi:hypothetical protein
MAEIRKHDPAVGNAIAQALRAAMGESVRPTVPGEQTQPATPAAPTTGGVVNFSITTTTVETSEESGD